MGLGLGQQRNRSQRLIRGAEREAHARTLAGESTPAVKQIRVRSEFESKVNGALSGDFDPRFLDRQKALEAAMNDINNSFGKGSVTRLGSADFALGGGLPKGRIVEIYGPESSGKTTIALHAIAEVQKVGGNAMLVDAEHAFDPAYSKALGVDVENLIVCQPDNGEMALEIADRMCRSGAIDLICVDSVSALTPRAEIEGEIGMQQMGLQARLMSQALRKMSGNASKAGCTLIFLNQIRHKIGVYYGNPEVTSGGIALKFFASLRLEIRPIGKIKSVKGDEDIGLRVRVRVQKSKVSRPYKQAEFEIIFGEGVSKLRWMLCQKRALGIAYGDQRLGQGRDRALQYLKENPLLCDEIEKIVRSIMVEGIGQVLISVRRGGHGTMEAEQETRRIQSSVCDAVGNSIRHPFLSVFVHHAHRRGEGGMSRGRGRRV
ncbi:hypothetical protein F0562_008623 [Nyssa sinensis]|uniref:RecA family profile 2 domain-containing protein n=1 Tax=Nyssa sinensis TaxID=561372 RepID=A0A5J5AAT3_9ASTE|nr:hypothetical protein F0562_008623 [Nyssa sinensis]